MPVERGDSRSSSDSSSGRPPLAPPQPPPAPAPDPESYSYVQLTAVHDYMYPVVGAGGSLKKQTPQPEPPNKQKERCRHCQVFIRIIICKVHILHIFKFRSIV